MAASLRRMRELEEQARLVPQLQVSFWFGPFCAGAILAKTPL